MSIWEGDYQMKRLAISASSERGSITEYALLLSLLAILALFSLFQVGEGSNETFLRVARAMDGDSRHRNPTSCGGGSCSSHTDDDTGKPGGRGGPTSDTPE